MAMEQSRLDTIWEAKIEVYIYDNPAHLQASLIAMNCI